MAGGITGEPVYSSKQRSSSPNSFSSALPARPVTFGGNRASLSAAEGSADALIVTIARRMTAEMVARSFLAVSRRPERSIGFRRCSRSAAFI